MEITAQLIIDLSIPIIQSVLTDQEKFEEDVKYIFPQIDAPSELVELLQQSQSTYDEAKILNIAKLLYDATYPTFPKNGVRYDPSPSYFKRYPALCFFEFAAQHNSVEGLSKSADILTSGFGNIPVDKDRASRYYYQAAQQGDLYSIAHCSKTELISLKTNGVHLANFSLFRTYYQYKNTVEAKACLDDILKNCTDDEINRVTKALNTCQLLSFSNKYDDAIAYLKKETDSFSIPQDPYTTKKRGCYIATCVYGSYDCSQVWTLRRFRDNTLGSSWYGRTFIWLYYAISPILVKWFGKTKWFQKFWKTKLDKLVSKLQAKGIANTPYEDKDWH